MNERLIELKEKITSFIQDYNIKEFYVDINDVINIDSINKPKRKTEVEINIKI